MKMICKVLKSIPGVAYGHLTLEAMQNWRMSKIDLFVREVLQNCSDAADPLEGEAFYVDFNIKEFNGASFINMLDGFETSVVSKFSDPHSKCIEIRDTGTTGLTGPLTVSQKNEKDHGNYYRLVFDTGKAQTQKYSGGNWGYGKSAYYGMGAGFVIYYSQIKEGEDYKSRLIVTLIENEEKEEAILRGHKDGAGSAGKAWWGKEIVGEGMEGVMLPLQDEEEIKEVLDVFGLKAFEKNETGTSVIIPYVNYSELMSNTISDEMDINPDIKNRCDWTRPTDEGFEESIFLAIQRWYAPAINNLELPKLTGKKWLYATVNERMLSYEVMCPFFQLVQKLYTAALAKTLGKEETGTEYSQYYNDTIEPIRIKNYIDNSNGGNTEVGYLAVAQIPKNKVNYGDWENIDPYLLLGYYEQANGNLPVVMFARRLGMVIDYAYKNEWVYGITESDQKNNDEYLFAFFVPFLGERKRLKSNLSVQKYAGKTLEEYLISCEASDHDGWEDHDKMTLVSSIQSNVTGKIKRLWKNEPEIKNVVTDRLGNIISKMLGITKQKLGKSVSKSNKKGRGGHSTSKKFEFKSVIKEYCGERQKLEFRISINQATKAILIGIMVNSDGSNLSSIEWERKIGTNFPVCFTDCYVKDSNIDSGEGAGTMQINSNTNGPDICVSLCNEERKTAERLYRSSGKTIITVVPRVPFDEGRIIEGELIIQADEKEYEYDLIAYEEEK